MKKYLYLFLVLVVFIIGVWLLNNFEVVSVKAWGENIITNTPFLQEYVQTNEAYIQLENELDNLKDDYERISLANEKLKEDLAEAQNLIEKQTETIENLEVTLEQLEEERVKEEERVSKLVKIYSKMDAKEAARIFTSLADDLVIQILRNLKEDKAAEILTALPTDIAANYSRALHEQ